MNLIEQLAAQRLGPAQQQEAPPQGGPVDPAAAMAAMQQAQAQQQPPQPKASQTPTQQEKAVAKVAPKDAGSEASIQFVELDDGAGNKRQLTHEQIKGTLDRYRDLNHKWQTDIAPIRPVLDVVKEMMAAAKAGGNDPKSEEMAELVRAAVKAYIASPVMGKGAPDQKPQQEGSGAKPPIASADEDGDLERWEKENAVKLPPGYKQQISQGKDLQGQISQILELLKGAQGPANTVASAAQGVEQQFQQAQGIGAQAAKQTIINNVRAAMMGAQLTPQDAPDFQAFSMARGYSPEDFIDAELTQTVVQDFKANRQAPEIQRLREVAQRRQAFTGSVDGAPGGGRMAPAAGAADPMFDAITSTGMNARGIR